MGRIRLPGAGRHRAAAAARGSRRHVALDGRYVRAVGRGGRGVRLHHLGRRGQAGLADKPVRARGGRLLVRGALRRRHLLPGQRRQGDGVGRQQWKGQETGLGAGRGGRGGAGARAGGKHALRRDHAGRADLAHRAQLRQGQQAGRYKGRGDGLVACLRPRRPPVRRHRSRRQALPRRYEVRVGQDGVRQQRPAHPVDHRDRRRSDLVRHLRRRAAFPPRSGARDDPRHGRLRRQRDHRAGRAQGQHHRGRQRAQGAEHQRREDNRRGQGRRGQGGAGREEQDGRRQAGRREGDAERHRAGAQGRAQGQGRPVPRARRRPARAAALAQPDLLLVGGGDPGGADLRRRRRQGAHLSHRGRRQRVDRLRRHRAPESRSSWSSRAASWRS